MPERLANGTLVFTDGRHRIGTDALLLAAFCPLRPRWSACDLGAGCGVLLLSLIDRGLAGRAVALEREPGAAALLRRAAAENSLETPLEIVCGDLREYRTGYPFDLVVCNPPYYKDGPASPDPVRAGARHEESAAIQDVCAAAARLLKDGGRFCLCWPPRRLAPLMAALEGSGLAAKRLQFVRKTTGDAPWLALVEARRLGGEGLTVLPDHILHAPLEY